MQSQTFLLSIKTTVLATITAIVLNSAGMNSFFIHSPYHDGWFSTNCTVIQRFGFVLKVTPYLTCPLGPTRASRYTLLTAVTDPNRASEVDYTTQPDLEGQKDSDAKKN